MKTSKKPESILITNATSKFETLAKTTKVMAVSIKQIVNIYFIFFVFVYIFAPTTDPIDKPK